MSKSTREEEYLQQFVRGPNPYQNASFLDKLLFKWIEPLIDISRSVDFRQDLHYRVSHDDDSFNAAPVFESSYRLEHVSNSVPPGTRTPVAGLLMAIWRSHRSNLIFGVVFMFVSILMEFITPILIYYSIETVQTIDYEKPMSEYSSQLWTLALYMGGFIFLRVFGLVLGTYVQYEMQMMGQRICTQLNVMLFKKLLRKCLERDTIFSMGDMTNLTEVDANAFAEIGFEGPQIIGIPLKLVIGVGGLFYLMGYAMLPAMVVMGLNIVGNIYITKMYARYRLGHLKVADQRGKLVNEIFKNIKFIKISGLEDHFILKHCRLRDDELTWIKWQFIRNNLANTLCFFGPYMFMLVLYIARYQITGSLYLKDAMVSAILFGVIQFSLRNFGIVSAFVMQTIVSGKRINFFLLSEEIDDSYIQRLPDTKDSKGSDKDVVIEISKANMYWINKASEKLYLEEKGRVDETKNKDGQDKKAEKNDKPQEQPKALREPLLDPKMRELEEVQVQYELALKDVNLSVTRGKCVAVIGKIGSGKTSLLSALVGEMRHEAGTSVKIVGNVALVSQKPWITAHTLREVLLFGSPMDEQRFADCIKYSGLEDDLKMMPQGVETMLGDRGVNLSGGQKMRLAIARALYADKDIYLFDDPISALDVHVGKLVMEEAILKYLRGKTRIVATHALSYLPYFDEILVMDEGRIALRGSYQQISQSEIYLNYKKSLEEDQERSSISSEPPSPHQLQLKKMSSVKKQEQKAGSVHEARQETQAGGDTEEEKVVEGIISSEDKGKGSVLNFKVIDSFIRFGGGYWWWLLIAFSGSMTSSADLYSNIFLQAYTTHPASSSFTLFVQVLFACYCIGPLFIFVRCLTYYSTHITRGRELSFLMTFKLLHSSINGFIDRVPMGRILNRFLKDLTQVDWWLGYEGNFILWVLFSLITDCIGSIIASSPISLIFFAIYFYLALAARKRIMGLILDVTRLRSISSSPLLQAYSEAVSGSTSIRSYGKKDLYVERYQNLQNEFRKNAITYEALFKWLNLKMYILSVIMMLPCIFINLYVTKSGVGMFAVLMKYQMVLLEDVNMVVGVLSLVESYLVSFERCTYFANIPSEKGYKSLEVATNSLRKGMLPKAEQKGWPTEGKIAIKDLKIKYRPSLPYVIKGISLDIPGGMKVGVVGRTGAGKSTLLSSLYMNFEDYEGEIWMDGKELKAVDLKELRNQVTVIPQEVYLFEGSLKMNVDPKGERSDAEVEELMREVGVWEKYKEKGGLEFRIEGSGSNMSEGEKQVLCIMRGLLRKSKVVLIDEATASVDNETDERMQKVMKERFKHCTVFTIAHRLNTILHSDLLLMLDNGSVLEYDRLSTLKNNPNSHFSRLLATYENMVEYLA